MTDLKSLFVNACESDRELVREVWAWLVPEGCRLLGFSPFADCFLEKSDGRVLLLDLVSGEVTVIADSVPEFHVLAELADYQERWFLASLVSALGDRRPVAGQCFAFRTPPLLGGELQPANVVLWDRAAYLEGLSTLFRKVLPLPPGTEIVLK